MFDEVSESITWKLKRRTVFLSILYLGMAFGDLIEYWYTRQVDYGLKAALWLTVAVLWAYRFRHFGEPQLTNLDIEARKQD